MVYRTMSAATKDIASKKWLRTWYASFAATEGGRGPLFNLRRSGCGVCPQCGAGAALIGA
jgi:hypothetical protein